MAQEQAFDFFVSYARADNTAGWIGGFVEELLKEHRAFTGGRELRPFFDTHAITTGADWQHYIAHGVAHSTLFLAFISPNYFASEWCRREWRAWLDAEIARHILTAGIRPIYVIEVPGLTGTGAMSEQKIAENIADLCKAADERRRKLLAETPAVLRQLRRRQLANDPAFSPTQAFHDAGVDALRRDDLRKVLDALARDLETHRRLLEQADASVTTVPPYNRKFTGRMDELLALRERLGKDDRTGIITGIQGLGGIGKTELAFAYAHAYAHAYPGGCFAIGCEHKTTLREAVLGEGSFTSLFSDQIGDEEKKQPQTYFAAIVEHLRRRLERLGHILLVLDNVSDAALLTREQTDQLTRLGPTLHLLATTRLPAPANARGNWLVLGRLPDSDALELLEKHRPFADDAERRAAERIVEQLGGFTLAVELVAAFLAVHDQSTSYTMLAEGLGLRGLDDIADDRDVELARHNAQRRLSAILEPLLTGRDALSPAERRTMEYAALLPPDKVPVAWLKSLVTADMPELKRTSPLGDPWARVIERLQRLALLTRDEGETTDTRTLRAHRLLQEFVRQRDPAAGTHQEAVKKLIEERDAVLDRTTHWQEARWEVEPLEAMAEMWAENVHPGAAWLLNQVGQRWDTLAEWGRAEPLYRRALLIDEQSYGKDHPEVAVRLNNLAALLYATNRLSEAEPLMRRALQIDEQSYSKDHPDVARDLNNLGQLLKATNRLSEAEPLMRRALRIDEQCYGEDHPEVATDLNNLALLLKATNRLSEVEPLYRRALRIDERSYGEDHPEVATDLNNLASLLQDANRLSEAEPLMRRALRIDEQSYGKDHPNVAACLSNLASLLYITNRLSEAEPLIRRALQIDEQSYGKDHPKVAIRLNNLARLMQDTNRLSEAEPLMRRTVLIFLNFTRATGHPYPHLQAAVDNYRALLMAMGQSREQAIAALRELAPELFEG